MRLSYKRIAACYFMIVAIMFVCILRLCSIILNPEYAMASETASSRKISLGFSRGTIYDCNGLPITNSKISYCNLIFDKPSAIVALYDVFDSAEIEIISDEIRNKGFAVRHTEEKISAEGIYSFATTEHSGEENPASHIIGYTDSEGKGVCGLELAYDDLLSSEEENYISFVVDGRGAALEGIEPSFSYDYKTESRGVRTTLDLTIQRIAEKNADNINCGAVVITEIETGKIRGLVSRPNYDLTRLGEALSDPNQPLLNRALCTYNIGSVFKPYVVATGYEKKIFYYTKCKGYTDIDGLVFACHNLGGHGDVNISSALKYSCNSFFYEYIQSIGGRSVIELSRKAGFESSIPLAKGLTCKAGSLGNTAVYENSKRSLANLSIGQGELMLSPIAITNLYMAIASDGCYRTPSLIEGEVEAGDLIKREPLPAKVRVMSETTAKKLRQDLAGVLEEGGTGKQAKPTLTTAAGKTGTAQTGIIKSGKKVTNSWFCGFFPLENPKYAVTVLSENADKSCSAIFAAIADEITAAERK